MKNTNVKKTAIKNVMRLLNPMSGLMQCRICGFRHWASLREDGKFYRGSWQCEHGCKRD